MSLAHCRPGAMRPDTALAAVAVMDLYETLGLHAGSTAQQIRRAFQKLARRYHPALNPGDPVAVVRFASIQQAFEVLTDPSRRAAYERGDLVLTPARPVPELGFEGFDFAVEARVEVAGFSEIFGAGDAAEARQQTASPGEDLLLTARIEFSEAFHGTRRRVHVVRQEQCAGCHGSGDAATAPTTCQRCGGSGQVRARRGHMVFRKPCGACAGTGSIRRQACGRCQGEGRVTQNEWIEVTIPPGVGEGSEVRMAGGGNAGRRGGAPGDLVLRVETTAHPIYAREGADLHCTVPVTMTEAALGGHIEVPTPDGSVAIELPAGTQTGHRFRLRGRGMPRPGEKGRGDLFIEARVIVTPVRDARSRELLEEVARLHAENPRAALLASSTVEAVVAPSMGAQSDAPRESDAARKTVGN